MRHKLRVLDIEQASNCPFYIPDTNKQSHCLLKLITNPQIITSVLESDSHADFDYWEMDCEGQWENCSILPLLYRYQEDSDTEQQEATSLEGRNKNAIQEYNPFDDSEDPDDYPDEPEPPVIVPTPEKNPDKPVELEQYAKMISIHRIDNPYLAKGDCLFYPTNNQLYIDDIQLRQMLRNDINNEINAYLSKPVHMGHVYVTTNGAKDSDKARVKSKFIYHAVVAGPSRLVNEKDIADSTFRALVKADEAGLESMVMLPADCGVLDIYATALVQLGAVKEFLMSHPETKIKKLFIVMTDEQSFVVFNKYYKRIFKKRRATSSIQDSKS